MQCALMTHWVCMLMMTIFWGKSTCMLHKFWHLDLRLASCAGRKMDMGDLIAFFFFFFFFFFFHAPRPDP